MNCHAWSTQPPCRKLSYSHPRLKVLVPLNMKSKTDCSKKSLKWQLGNLQALWAKPDLSKFRQSTIYYAGLLWWWDKRIIGQESDVPSIVFFNTIYRLRALKTLYLYFCNFILKKMKKMIERIFAKNFARNHEKKKYCSILVDIQILIDFYSLTLLLGL